MDTSLKQSFRNIIMFDTIKSTLHISRGHKGPTPHSAALLNTCLNVAVTPAVDLPGSHPKMFVSCGFLSRLTADCKARI